MSHLKSDHCPAQNTINPTWATRAPSNLPSKLISRAFSAHQEKSVVSFLNLKFSCFILTLQLVRIVDHIQL